MRTPVLFLAALPLAAQSLTAEQWRADLAVLAKELPARHVNAFAHITKRDFDKEVRELNDRIPSLSDPQIRAGFLRIIASIGDGRTRMWSQGRLAPFHVLPLGLYWFKDGIFVVSAAEECRDLVGGKLDRLGGLSVEEASRALEPLFAHENEAERRLGLPALSVNADLLFAVGVTESADRELTLEISENWEPVPDVAGVLGPRPKHAYPDEPPAVVIEILSPSDRFAQLDKNAAAMRSGA